MRPRAAGRALPTLRGRLIALVAVVALPLCAVIGLAASLVQDAASEQSRAGLLTQARSLADDVDSEIGRGLAILRTLSATESIARGDLDAAEREMRKVAAAESVQLGLHGATTGMLLTTAWPVGDRRTGVPSAPAVQEALATGRAVITDLVMAAQQARPVVAVVLPLAPPDDPAPFHALALAIPRERFRALVTTPPLNGHGDAAILDRGMRLVAHSGDDTALVGVETRGPLIEAARTATEGVMREVVVNADGVRVIAAFARAPLSGYTATASISEATFRAPLRDALLRVLPVGVAVMLAGLAISILLGRRIAGAVSALAALGRGERPAPSGLREVDDVTSTLLREAEDRRIAQQRQALLMAELNHRVKNVLASVQSVAVQTLRGAGGDPARFAEDFNGRLRSLAAAHDLLTERAWAGADVAAVIDTALAPWRNDDRLHFSGTDRILLTPLQAQSLVLALHELATNASKHGALSVPGGRVTVMHATEEDGTALLTWTERGGPPVPPQPERRGFGLRLLQRGLAPDLGRNAKVEIDFAPGGVTASIRFTPAG